MSNEIVKSARKDVKILEINLTSTSKVKALASVRDFISYNRKFYIVTPNPELILMAQRNFELKKALNQADIAIPDGVGLKVADSSLKIIKGRELFIDLVALANKKGWRVFFLGGKGDEANEAAQKLSRNYKSIKIKFSKGPGLNIEAKPISEVDMKVQIDTIDAINNFKPHLLFVAFGNPKQEIWINKNLSSLDIGGAMAVGGVFRYIAGYSKLPPAWMERLGLEWLWRLLIEPYRAGRIFSATIVFPLRVWIYRLLRNRV